MSSDYDDYSDGSAMEESDSGYDAFDGDVGASLRKAPYAVLDRRMLQKREHEAIEAVVSILGIREEEAISLLRKYKWCVNAWCTGWASKLLSRLPRPHPAQTAPWRLRDWHPCDAHDHLVPRAPLCCANRDPNRANEEWFGDVDAVRASLGIVEPAPPSTSGRDKVGWGGTGWQDLSTKAAHRCGDRLQPSGHPSNPQPSPRTPNPHGSAPASFSPCHGLCLPPDAHATPPVTRRPQPLVAPPCFVVLPRSA